MLLNPFQLKKRIAEVEAHIEALEIRLGEVTAAIEVSSAEGDGQRIRALGAEYAQLETELRTTMDEWGLLAE